MSPREHLALIADGLYGPDALTALATATLPQWQPGERMDDSQCEAICSALSVVRDSGCDETTLIELVANYRRHGGAQWRERFWRLRLAAAARATQEASPPTAIAA